MALCIGIKVLFHLVSHVQYIYCGATICMVYVDKFNHKGLELYASLCVSRPKGKAGIQLKCIPEKRDTTEMYLRKVMHIIG